MELDRQRVNGCSTATKSVVQTLQSPPTTLAGLNQQTGAKEIQTSLGRGVAVVITHRRSSARLIGTIHDVHADSLSILVKHPLPEGTAVRVEFGAITCSGEVSSCRPSRGLYELSVVIPNEYWSDSRNEQRFPITEEVLIGSAQSDMPLPAVVANVSVHGLCLELARPLREGEIIRVEAAATEAFGVVRYVRPAGADRFQAGVEVFDVMPNDV